MLAMAVGMGIIIASVIAWISFKWIYPKFGIIVKDEQPGEKDKKTV
jgi:energy-converting hydrogenase Eha subunit B